MRAELTYRPLLALLAAGVAVRIWVMAAYFPAVMTSFDTPRFARVLPQELFGDFWMPAAYPAMLKALHGISDDVWLTVAVQHLLGIAAAVVLYLACRRLDAPRPLACVPAAVLLLSGDHLFLEHIMLADGLLTVLGAFGLGAAVHGLVPRPDARWLAAAGALLAGAGLTRSPGMVLLLALAVCVAVGAPGALRARARPLAAVLGGAAVVLVVYVAAFQAAGGPYLGLADMRGWNLYTRVAPFADCSRFTPPPGTTQLCDPRPAAQRPGPFGFVWDLESVARRSYPLGPPAGEPLGRFAAAALRAQPGDYARAVGTDLVRYAFPSVARGRDFSGQGPDLVSFGFADAGVERLVTRAMARRYDGVVPDAGGREALATYQRVVRVHGVLLVALLLLAVAGAVRLRGPLRLGVVLFGLAAVGLYVVPVLSVSYDFRYGIPPATFLAVAGTLAAAGLAGARRARRSPRD